MVITHTPQMTVAIPPPVPKDCGRSRPWPPPPPLLVYVTATINMIGISMGASMVVTLYRDDYGHPNPFFREDGGMGSWPPYPPEMTMAITPPFLKMLWSRGGNGHHTPHR